MSYVSFERSREEKKKARELILEKAEADYNRRKYQEEQRKERGEDKWMLPSVEARLKAEAKEMKKEKKDKKKKKKKKKKRERKSSSSSSSEGEDQWVEKKAEESPPPPPPKNEAKEREEWMAMPGLFPCISRDELREKTRTKSEAELKKEKDKYMLDSLGQSNRELNPYWKDGGCGLPQAPVDSNSVTLAAGNVGDGGANWLRRGLERAKQQAAEEGRSLEEVAAERWGSLQKLQSLIDEAENRSRPARSDRRVFRKPEGDDYRRSGGFRKPGADDERPSHRSYSSSQSSGSKNWKKKVEPPRREEPARRREEPTRRREEPTRRREEPERRKSPSPSSSSSDEAATEAPTAVLTEKEMNELGAKLIKAELLGNETLAAELKKKLDAARTAKSAAPASSSKQGDKKEEEEETVILTRTDRRGFVRPCAESSSEPLGGRRRKQKVETHADGKRIRYFADDDKYSLQEMFEREKLSTVEDQNEAFAKMAAKGVGRPDSEYDMDDVFAERARLKESDAKAQARERSSAIREHKKVEKALDGCRRCFDNKETKKHLIVAIGTKAYLSLPPHEPLTPGHCLLIPMYHVPCATQLDEDVWAEIKTFRSNLTAMFSKMDQDVMFFETAMHLNNFPHMVLECVPVPKDVGAMAAGYFKKAIEECEMEWSNNKKLVSLKTKDVRRSVPKGLPYFFVDFGLDGGYAHVIEDEKLFSREFAYEIIGGMLDVDYRQCRRNRPSQSFESQCKKVVEFSKWWKPYDFTRKQSKAD